MDIGEAVTNLKRGNHVHAIVSERDRSGVGHDVFDSRMPEAHLG